MSCIFAPEQSDETRPDVDAIFALRFGSRPAFAMIAWASSFVPILRPEAKQAVRAKQEIRSEIAAALLIEKIVRDTYTAKSSSEIQPLQWSILRYLERSPPQRCTMSWIKSFLGLTHAPVVRAISTLVKRGLIEQKPNPDDARSNLLQLTQEGVEALNDDPIVKVANRMKQLPMEDRESLMKLIRTLALSTNGEGEGADDKHTADR